MLFNSFDFLVFFPIVTFLYFVLPHKWRWFLLLAASSYFYMAFIPVYILILLATIIVDYFAGILIENAAGRRRKLFLILSIVTNVGFLAIFKYFNFAAGNLTQLAQFLHWNYSIPLLSMMLPIGLSFHTFQAMSYTVEVYRGGQKAERHFGIYALYVMFYPQLVAGPIERPQNLLHQFYEKHNFDYERIVSGLKLMMWGMFKKVVIADRVASLVDAVYGDSASFHGPGLAIATILFAFQIYCDFSGYSDIAIGSAKVMGFRLMNNFNRPYSAKSIAEFWQRWHISLSTWFKDYVYIPLGGSRVGARRFYFNVLLVFLLSGFWHGANWTFIVWGALFGIYLIIAHATAGIRARLVLAMRLNAVPGVHKIFQNIYVFVLVSFGWIFFRSGSLSEAFYIVKHLGSGWSQLFSHWRDSSFLNHEIFLGQGRNRLLLSLVLLIVLETVQYLQNKEKIFSFLSRSTPLLRWGIYVVLFWTIIFLGKFGERQFIYFVF